MSYENEKIQIVAFSTNDTKDTPQDIIKIYLSFHQHKILKINKKAIAFSMVFDEEMNNKETKVMICSVLNLKEEYVGITDVNCYLLFVDLEKEESKEKVMEIMSYMREYCDESKKIFIIGMCSFPEKNVPLVITEKDLSKKLNELDRKYEFRKLNIANTKDVADYILSILTFSKKHGLDEESEIKVDRDQGQSNSCCAF